MMTILRSIGTRHRWPSATKAEYRSDKSGCQHATYDQALIRTWATQSVRHGADNNV